MTNSSSADRWNRGCGTGIGLSHHKNEYRLGVNIQNWTEDREAVVAHGVSVVAGAGRFDGATTMATSFTQEGKFGQDAIEASQRQDILRGVDNNTRGQKILVQHGDPAEPPCSSLATLNELTLTTKQLGEPRVQSYLWSGSKLNDKNVPGDGTLQQAMTTTKKQMWAEQEHFDMYKTTSKVFQEPVVGEFAKRDTIKPEAQGGQKAQVGRKAKGEMMSSFENPANRIGLRQPTRK